MVISPGSDIWATGPGLNAKRGRGKRKHSRGRLGGLAFCSVSTLCVRFAREKSIHRRLVHREELAARTNSVREETSMNPEGPKRATQGPRAELRDRPHGLKLV